MNKPRASIALVPIVLLLGLTLTLSAAAAESAGTSTAPAYVVDHSRSSQARLRPLPLEAVEWTTGFWADRYRQLCEVTLEESWKLLADPAEGHVLDNFRFAAKPGSGKYAGTTWQDEWLYKWIEAAACVWRLNRDPALTRRMDEAIALIAAAQQPDGYLSTMPTASQKPRFQNAQDHEIYNMGHLLTAGVIHHRMTGQNSLLDVARRAGDFLCANLGVTVKPYMAHNPSAIMGLVELSRLTGDPKYLACAQLIVDRRGAEPRRQSLWAMQPGIEGTDVIQDRVPVRASQEVVGHNVFFAYLYAGAADLCSEHSDPKLADALGRLWMDLTSRKMFINGGVSARPITLSHGAPAVEAAGAPYELPNSDCYNETCGQIGVFMWGYRMLVNQPDASYADIMEREMFNGFLPCLGLDGRSWFYRAVLRRYDADYKPAGWNDMPQRGTPGRTTICCPSNLLRTMAQLSAYFYSRDENGLWVHHYGGSKVTCRLTDTETFAMEQITDYPWSGDIKIVIRQAPAKPVAVRLRAPGWAGKAAVTVNGKAVATPPTDRGYLSLTQVWQPGDAITLSLPFSAQLIAADPRVEATRNQVAVMRGPILYCVESPDLPDGISVPDVHLASDATFMPTPGLAGGAHAFGAKITTLRGQGLCLSESPWTELYRPLTQGGLRPFELRLIPYFAWSNRGRSAMSVWIPLALKPR
ncbi:MAG: glycoside hydrolase family 127 protein [Candidatus Sumerlaeota bacterium]|nr:glycoside hydrolase family 127 protein [Candidatus Sumerlaeota bacterium]